MEEVMEIITWNYLGIHNKPIVVFNVGGYYDDIFRWLRKAVESGFVDEANIGIVLEATTAEEVIAAIRDYKVTKARLNLEWKQGE